ncbi:anthranilate n-hydroxycinnamoyl/benzoyltransferase [Apiospora saccharicola]
MLDFRGGAHSQQNMMRYLPGSRRTQHRSTSTHGDPSPHRNGRHDRPHPPYTPYLPPTERDDLEGGEWGPLSIWNQHAPRVYISVVLCFPHDGQPVQSTLSYLRSKLAGLARKRPIFAARLRIDPRSGVIQQSQPPQDEIPLEFSRGDEWERYDEMKSKGFSPELFLGDKTRPSVSFDTTQKPIPACTVHARFVQGGLFLVSNLQHAVCDGETLREFLECFAAETRGDPLRGPSSPIFSNLGHLQTTSSDRFMDLVAMCPEYTTLPDRTGPTQPRYLDGVTPLQQIDKVGRIFTFTDERIKELQRLTCSEPSDNEMSSTYACLAALAFTHIVRARTETEEFIGSAEETDVATLWNSVNWKYRALIDRAKDYLGNATFPTFATNSAWRCSGPAQTPRLVGVNSDPRQSNYLAFNTWRHFGADAEWKIPGVPVTKPDAIRRGLPTWTLNTALILPAAASSKSQELFVCLSRQEPLFILDMRATRIYTTAPPSP